MTIVDNPFAVMERRLNRNEELLLLLIKKIEEKNNIPDNPDIINITQAASLLGYTVSSCYGLVNKKVIPFIKKKGTNRLFFSRSELLAWLDSGRVSPKTDIEQKANDFLVKR